MSNSQSPCSKAAPNIPNEPSPAIRIVLADDHAIVREGLRALLESEPRFQVVGEAGDGRAAVNQVQHLAPDVVVIDVMMPGLNGVEATVQIKALAPQVKVVALSMHSHQTLVKRMLQAGAQAFLLKDCAGKDLVAAINSVMADHFYFSATITRKTSGKPNCVRPLGFSSSLLSHQQRELLQLVAEGNNTKQIAERLNLSPKTIDIYRRRMMNKLRILSIAELTKYAIREGITSPDF